MQINATASSDLPTKRRRHFRRLLRSAWFQIFASGVVLFYLLDKSLSSTQNPNFIPSLIMIGAFLMPVTLVAYFYERLPAGVLPIPAVATCFLWGGAIGVLIAGFLEYRTLRDLGALALLGVGLIEESAKLVVPVTIFLRGRYRSEMSGLLFGVASGMGFAALETMGYAFVAFIDSRGNIGVLEETLLVRGLLSPAGHAAWTGLVCAVLWRERLRVGRVAVNRAVGGAFLLAVVLHALWDTFNSLRGPTFVDWLGLEVLSLFVAILSLILLIRRAREAGRAIGAHASVEAGPPAIRDDSPTG